MLLTGKRMINIGGSSFRRPLKRQATSEPEHLMEVPPSIISPPPPSQKSYACKLIREEVVNEMMNELTAKVEKWMESNKKCLPRTRPKLGSALKSLCFLSGEINFDILFCSMLTKHVIEVSYIADIIYKIQANHMKPTLLHHNPTIASFYEEAIIRICNWMQLQKDALPKTKEALQKRLQPFLVVRLSIDPEYIIQQLIHKGWIVMVGDTEGHYVYKEVQIEEHDSVSSSNQAVEEDE